MSAAVRATSGAAILHGPHQSAQKSTRTGTFAPEVTSRNVSGSASIGVLTGEISVLHTPQRPVSASRSAGDRFFLPQDGHFRITTLLLARAAPLRAKPHHLSNSNLRRVEWIGGGR